ncbi:molybdopterin-dependent oxidoreductase [Dyella sp.]|jgi:DMSO/TMAO reductase YedYZ molybdopterin-dependent catalytic subunit|uniref:molybdopterin-dependent oxidoreductase n=1 Tax=Dyella sp. TaxID=1869338 RepID=UPI002D780A98|nr:molybdopterin-dependent oxidoreductase [Dyella sp.]HET6433183.1 molybdopterin-dependent oxidoreductase [Dyella sp.]
MSEPDHADSPGTAFPRLPPRQVVTAKFPVMSKDATPALNAAHWALVLKHGVRPLKRWDSASFDALPRGRMVCDIHCVTRWSKLDTAWEGVMLDDLLADAGIAAPTGFLLAHSADGYVTNLAVEDVLDGRAMIATHYDGQPLAPAHGGPARLLVPHLYFWKSAKWLTGLQFTVREEAGFWELRCYHRRGDPWKEQRFAADD